MRVLELFCGVNKSVGKVAQALGWEVTSVDINPKANADHLDILHFDETAYPQDHFQFIWASPPCESYSTARTNAKVERAEAMRNADRLVAKTRQIIVHFGCQWAIENPLHSKIWTREVSCGLKENSCITSYCSFGYAYRKDTRIASSFGLKLPRCPGAGLCPSMVGSRHIEHAQKGGGGVSGRYHSLDELHSIPNGFIKEIFRQLSLKWPERSCTPYPRLMHTISTP